MVGKANTKRWIGLIELIEFHPDEDGFETLHITFNQPLPDDYKTDKYAFNNILCLRNNEYGGIWRIIDFIDNNKNKVYCEIWKPKKRHDDDSDDDDDKSQSKRNNNNNQLRKQFKWEVIQTYTETETETCIVPRDKIKPENVYSYDRDQFQKGYAFLLQTMVAHSTARILSISSIETVDQSFAASFSCEVRFRGLGIHHHVEYTQQFLDILNIENALTILNWKEKQSCERWSSYSKSSIKSNSDDGTTFDYTYKIKAQGIFHKEFKLHNFPLDIQQLDICLTCDRPDIIQFKENYEYPSLFKREDFHLNSIFKLPFNEKVFTKVTSSKPEESWSQYIYPRVTFTIYLQREHWYYISNVCIPIGLLSGLCIISMGINEDGSRLDTGSRLAITLTLLLTGVAYKFVVADSLPKLSYTTMLDKYVWLCFLFTMVIAVENTIVPIILHRYKHACHLDDMESYIVLAFGIVYVVMNVACIVIAKVTRDTVQQECDGVDISKSLVFVEIHANGKNSS